MLFFILTTPFMVLIFMSAFSGQPHKAGFVPEFRLLKYSIKSFSIFNEN